MTVVSMARTNDMLGDLLNMHVIIVNVVGASCKHIDALQANYHSKVLMKLNIVEFCGGSCRFQEMSMAQPGNTRWESHLLTINRVVSMFNAIINVLENISKDGINSKQRSVATKHMSTMKFVNFKN